MATQTEIKQLTITVGSPTPPGPTPTPGGDTPGAETTNTTVSVPNTGLNTTIEPKDNTAFLPGLLVSAIIMLLLGSTLLVRFYRKRKKFLVRPYSTRRKTSLYCGLTLLLFGVGLLCPALTNASEALSQGVPKTGSTTITLANTEPYGYTVYACMPDGNALTNADKTISIPSTKNASTLDNLAVNTWGLMAGPYQQSTSELNNIPTNCSSPRELYSTEQSTQAGSLINLTIGANIDTNIIPVGQYSGSVTLKVVGKEGPIAPTTMQEMTPEYCKSMPLEQTITLTDIRDNKNYYVTKEKDGKCWMTQNLDLDLSTAKTLTPEDTDITDDFTPIHSTFTKTEDWTVDDDYGPYSYDAGSEYIFTNNDATPSPERDPTNLDPVYQSLAQCVAADHTAKECQHYHTGNLYNWSAAVASNDTSSFVTRDTVMPNSICPKGWKLPTAKSYPTDFGELFYATGLISSLDEGTNFATADGINQVRKSPMWIPRSGIMSTKYSEHHHFAGWGAYFWSNTVFLEGKSSRYMHFNATPHIYQGIGYDRGTGMPIRCIAK